MFVGIGMSLVSRLASGGFSPAVLFSAGQDGAWYEAFDLDTLFQESTGTTPVTAAGQPVGLMLDKSQQQTFEARRNLLNYSEDGNEWSLSSDGTITANSYTSPLGANTATLYTEASGNGLHRMQISQPTFDSTTTVYTVSFFFKNNGTEYVYFSPVNSTAAGNNISYVFDVSGTPVYNSLFTFGVTREPSNGGYIDSSVEDVGDGWYIISLTLSKNAVSGTGNFVIGSISTAPPNLATNVSTSYAGDGVSGFYVTGFQIEAGSTATAYQSTTTLPVSWTGNHALQATAAARPTYQTSPDRLTMDKVDDRLVANLPAIDGTMVFATPEGTAAYGVNISAGNYDIGGRGGDYFPGSALVGQVIRDGAMTQAEIDRTITHLRANGGGESYGDVTDFSSYWRDWDEIVTFPAVDLSAGTDFGDAWRGCSALANFPSGRFNTVTATAFDNAFTDTALSQTSIDNILVSINTANTSNGTFDQSGGSAPSAVGEAAIDALWSRGWDVDVTGGYTVDADAAAYVAAVEAADGQSLEPAVRLAILNFIRGCKTDGIWDALKASCIMAGARTLAGALVPLVGTAPTNNNFVSGDYNRKTGLKGDGSTKYLDSNRANNADPQDSRHLCGYVQQMFLENEALGGSGTSGTGGRTLIWRGSIGIIFASVQNTDFPSRPIPSTPAFIGMSRFASNSTTLRAGSSQTTDNTASLTPASDNISIFAYTAPTSGFYSSARLSFYSIGEALDLAALDTRVSNLMTDLGNAIP